MAIRINAELETESGFKTDKALAFLDIMLPVGGQWVNLRYYESPASFKAKKESITFPELPSVISFEIATNVFWGNNLAMAIHNGVKNEIEKITGPNTVTIIQDPYS